MKAKKGKKSNQADALYTKKTKVIAKKVNPFELHENRDKFNVMNRQKKHSLGRPTASRSLALEKRKQTLGAEFKQNNKVNVFQDHRRANGGGGGGFQAPKQSIYNLNESEVLTHGGQTLAEIERFDDVAQDEDEMSDDEARLDAKFTEAAHFGNFNDGEDQRDRKTVIDELIAESKKRKIDKAREHEEILVLTDKLDSDWKELLPVVSKLHKQESEQHVPDAYDRLVKEMIFAPRGEPTEKLKNEEDVARIEKERLEKLERERLARMRGDQDDGDKKPKHRSADDLDDGYLLEPVEFGNDDGEKVLSYAINEENGADHDESGEYLSAEEGKEEVEDENESEESASEEEEEESDDDSLDDLKNDEESEEESEPVIDPKVLVISTPEAKVKPTPKAEVKESALTKKTNEALEKIPYTIAMPDSYESLQELLENHPVKIQAIIVERIIKTNHVRLLHVNRSKMLKLFAFLLQYVNDGFSNVDSDNIGKRFKLLAELSPHMYDLIQMNPEEGSKCFLEVVKEKYEDFKKNSKKFPPLESLIFFKLLGSLFPTSDFRHPIVTPTNVFLHHILSQAKVRSRSDVASGLFLSTLVLDHQQLSKKFLPAVMNFLSGVSYLGVKKSMVEQTRPLLPFKKNDSLLVLESKFKGDFSPKLSAEDFLDSPVDDDFKVRALNIAVHLMADFVKLYDELVGLKYFLDPFESVLNRLVDDESLPKELKKYIKSTLAEFQRIRLDKKFVFPQPERKIQPMIRMLEPRIETVLSDRRSMFSQHTGAKAEEQKLKHMVKREFKSAKRELRRDNEFLSKIRHKRKQDMDRERVAKVKRIFNEASTQQSEYNALSRTKGRKGKF